MQVWLPAASKANTWEAGADVKDSGFIQVPATWKTHLKAHPNNSSAGIFIARNRDKENKEIRGRGYTLAGTNLAGLDVDL